MSFMKKQKKWLIFLTIFSIFYKFFVKIDINVYDQRVYIKLLVEPKYIYIYIYMRNDISTTFLQQILSDKLLLVVIVRLKK